VSAPSKERGRLGYHHYKKQLRRLCTFHGEYHKEDTNCSNQGVKATFKKPSPIINLTTSEVKLVKKFKPIDKSNQSNSVGSFGYDFGQDRKLINLVADHIAQPIQEMHSLDDDIVRECVRSFLASKTE
tara:strand:+ start:1276 stop:1659 length:384 start_codon:yes stop_codon:yes gene_type:complete